LSESGESKLARPKSSKILIKRGDEMYSLMWANVGPDGSIMIGFPLKGKQQVISVIDKNIGELRPPSLITEDVIGRFKISFHPSGQVKLTTKMGKDADAIDRVTVECSRFEDINGPRRIVEFLLPKKLPLMIVQPTEKDIILDATTAPERPLRCTLSYMSIEKLQEHVTKGSRFVDTSIWEAVNALAIGTSTWVWTLRVSINDNIYPERFFIMLIGNVKWGKRSLELTPQ
jgi:hypothetical protein